MPPPSARSPAALTAADVAELAARGLPRAEAERQLALLADPPAKLRLERPCTVGDGIVRLSPDEQEESLRRHERARLLGRLTKFVPASGAASRMFQTLFAFLADPQGEGRREAEAFAAALPRLALRQAVDEALVRRGQALAPLLARGDLETLVGLLLEPDGLDFGARPKALIPFHDTPDGPRTALEEQLVSAVPVIAGADRLCRLHFSIPAGSAALFAESLARLRGFQESRLAVRFEVGFSYQDPSTDTLALDADGRPARRADGHLLLRPGGHGALLGNLERLGADLVLIQNIDNVLPEPRQVPALRWQRILCGLLAGLVEEQHAWQRRLRQTPADSTALDGARRFLDERLGVPTSQAAAAEGAAAAEALAALLHRPLRVCGVVPNAGEPGGGPFWVRGRDGSLSRQIVERAEIEGADAEQVKRFSAATHFNPVALACSLRDALDQPYALADCVDAAAVFIAEKSEAGRRLRALERPGLWNGAMAGWHTLFVEMPAATFAPVKTILDLDRPEHRA